MRETRVANQFGPEKVYGRGRDLRNDNGVFFAYGEGLEDHWTSSAGWTRTSCSLPSPLPVARTPPCPHEPGGHGVTVLKMFAQHQWRVCATYRPGGDATASAQHLLVSVA